MDITIPRRWRALCQVICLAAAGAALSGCIIEPYHFHPPRYYYYP